jgi:hypothetical protein
MASRAGSVVARMLLTALACAALGFCIGLMFPVLVNPTGNIFPAMLIYSVLLSVCGFLIGLIAGLVKGLRRAAQFDHRETVFNK